MTTFDDRERAFEAAFAHDQEMRFRAIAHRNHNLGLWAAGKMGKTGQEAEDYARGVMYANVAQAGDQVVIDKVTADLATANVTVAPEEIGRVMVQFGNDAILAQKGEKA